MSIQTINNIPFIFNFQKQCCDCHRYYCGQCLSIFNAGSTTSPLLQRIVGRNLKCMICKALSKRPLMRSHLQQFRAKELQSYLMSQNVSTRGCVGKVHSYFFCFFQAKS